MTRFRFSVLAVCALFLSPLAAEAQRPSRAPAPKPSAASPVAPAPTLSGYDFFVIAGQSNAKGNGDMNQSERTVPGAAYEITRRGEFAHLADPVGNANTGSAWPAFAKAYTEQTGRGVVMISLPRPGTAQFKGAHVREGNHWDIRYPDNLYDHSADLAARAYVVAEASLPDVRFGGWLWIQGGADAIAIHEGKQTVEQYEDAYHRLARQVYADWGAPMLHILTGSALSGDVPAGNAVRQAQARAHEMQEVVVIHHDAVEFAERGWHVDEVHWDQRGLNEAGLVGGETAGRWANGEAIPDPDPRDPNTQPGTGGGGTGGSEPTLPEPPTIPGLPSLPGLPGIGDILSIAPNPSVGRPPRVETACDVLYQVLDVLGREVKRGRSKDGTIRLPRRIGVGQFTLRTIPAGAARDGCVAATATFTVLG